MRVNPHLQVHIEYGYYDLATPYHAAEDMVAHLRLPDEAFGASSTPTSPAATCPTSTKAPRRRGRGHRPLRHRPLPTVSRKTQQDTSGSRLQPEDRARRTSCRRSRG